MFIETLQFLVIIKYLEGYILIKFFLKYLAESQSPVDFCVAKHGMHYI